MFIYKKEGALSPELCRSFIDAFEADEDKAPGVLYGPDGHSTEGKKSTDLTFHPGYLEHETWGPLLQPLIETVNSELISYASRHELVFKNLDSVHIDTYFNMQRYLPNEGFSQWHCERAGLKHAARALVWMVYLNDVTDRGETEFFYQHHFERPKEGNLLIWPSDFTHMHRGISSPTQSKYILTGWFTHRPRKDE